MHDGLRTIPGTKILGQPIGPFAFGSDDVNIYQVMDQMSARGWALTGLLEPGRDSRQPDAPLGAAGRGRAFCRTRSRESCNYVRDNPDLEGGMAPIYGMAAAIPDRSFVHEMLRAGDGRVLPAVDKTPRRIAWVALTTRLSGCPRHRKDQVNRDPSAGPPSCMTYI